MPAATAMQFLQMHKDTNHIVNVNVKPEKFPRPKIGLEETAEKWDDFNAAWLQYKAEYSLNGAASTRQLYACCSDELATSLSRMTGGTHFTLTEADMIDRMKQLAIQYQNPAVHVQTFLSMSQHPDEGARHWFSRLKGISTRCDFQVKCTCDQNVSYADPVILYKLISGLSDTDIKEDILSQETLTLEETVKLIEAKESGKRAKGVVGVQSNMSSTSGAANSMSTSQVSTKNNQCSHCGNTDHGSGKEQREKSCPAFNLNCGKCGNQGHFKRKCKSTGKKQKNKAGAGKVDGEEAVDGGQAGAIHASTLHIMAIKEGVKQVAKKLDEAAKNEVRIPHMLYHQIKGWVKEPPPPQPNLKLEVSTSVSGYQAVFLKPPPATRRRTADTQAMADTGCQAVCMGLPQLHSLGLNVKDLITPAINLKAANETGIKILGAAFINIMGVAQDGKKWSTQQLAYVAEGLNQLLLSKQACVELGIIPHNFPQIGSHHMGKVAEISVDDLMEEMMGLEGDLVSPCKPRTDGSCDCPRRTLPPPPPEFPRNASAQQLKETLLKHYASSSFNRCTRQILPMMKGEPLRIHTKPDAIPIAVHSPIPVPIHWREQVEADLERDVALGVIEPVPTNTPSTWISRMVLVPKHDGSPRRTVDFKALNDASVRQTHHSESPFMLATRVPSNMKKSVLDVWNSYHSVPVHEDDHHKLTFITHKGRFRYKVAPQGYLASGDGFTQRSDSLLGEVKDRVTKVDDSLVWAKNMEDNFYQVCKMLEVGGNAGLVFNGDKFQFGQDIVEFAGLEVTNDGVRPSRRFLDAISNLPTPSNITDVRAFFGMVNQVNYAFAMSDIMEPFRHLLKPGTPFLLTSHLENSFVEAKKMIVEAVKEGVKYFEMGRITCLATDWSRKGMGFFLMQKWCNCSNIHPRCCLTGWKLVLAGGRFTTPSESRYSSVEGEMLAVVDSLHKARHFVLGCRDLVVAVDHKPLLGLLDNRSLEEVENPRLLLLKTKTLWYSFKMVHVPGKKNCGPDYMSRRENNSDMDSLDTKDIRIACILAMAGGNSDNSDKIELSNQIEEVLVGSVSSRLHNTDGLSAVTFERVKAAVTNDETLLALREAILNTNSAMRFPPGLDVFNKYRDSLHVLEGVPMYGYRVIVPTKLRKEVLDGLHAAHQSVAGMLERATQAVFWPGLYQDLEETRAQCNPCNERAPSQAALPPSPIASPEYPFQMIVADYFSLKSKSWLVVADRFTGWVSVYYFNEEAKAKGLIKTCRMMFETFGVPEDFSSDFGPQFKSTEFQEFLLQYGVENHRVSSAYFPHSNLRAETAVKSAKRLLMTCTKADGTPIWDKMSRALLQHRNTPIPDLGASPAQLLFGRPIRDFLPIKPGLFRPSDVWVDCQEKRELALRRRQFKEHEKWSMKTRDLPYLNLGQKVMVQNQKSAGALAKRWDRTGTVVEDKGHRKYSVRIDGSGRLTDRNRQFLRSFKAVDKEYMPAPPTGRPPISTPQMPVTPPGGLQDGSGPSPSTPRLSPGLVQTPRRQTSTPARPMRLPVTAPLTPVTPTEIPAQEHLPVQRGTLFRPETPSPAPSPVEVRRSVRNRQPNVKYGEAEYELGMITVVAREMEKKPVKSKVAQKGWWYKGR